MPLSPSLLRSCCHSHTPSSSSSTSTTQQYRTSWKPVAADAGANSASASAFARGTRVHSRCRSRNCAKVAPKAGLFLRFPPPVPPPPGGAELNIERSVGSRGRFFAAVAGVALGLVLALGAVVVAVEVAVVVVVLRSMTSGPASVRTKYRRCEDRSCSVVCAEALFSAARVNKFVSSAEKCVIRIRFGMCEVTLSSFSSFSMGFNSETRTGAGGAGAGDGDGVGRGGRRGGKGEEEAWGGGDIDGGGGEESMDSGEEYNASSSSSSLSPTSVRSNFGGGCGRGFAAVSLPSSADLLEDDLESSRGTGSIDSLFATVTPASSAFSSLGATGAGEGGVSSSLMTSHSPSISKTRETEICSRQRLTSALTTCCWWFAAGPNFAWT